MVQRSLPFLVLAGLVSCKGDPTGDLRNGTDHLNASPTSLFVTEGTTKLVVITAVDEQGNPVTAKFSAAQVAGPGVTVTRDLTYLPVYDDKGNLVEPKEVTSARYIVSGDANTANTSFSVTAGGKSIDIPVRIIPSALNVATLSTATPNAGDTVTITLPNPYRFTPASTAAVGATALFKASISADSTTMKVVGPPGLNGAVTLTNIKLSYAPGAATLTATTSAALATPALPSLALNKTNAVAGDTIVATLPAAYRFTPGGSTVTVGTAGLALIGVSADSSQIRFLIGPSANDTVKVSGVRLRSAAALGPFTPNSAANKVVTPALTAQTVGLSSTTPNINGTVTVTAPTGFKFLPTAKVYFGNAQQHVLSVAADSNSLVMRATAAGASGTITIGNSVLSFLTTVPFTMTTTNAVTTGATITSLAGTDALATAPTITIPDAGKTYTLRDAGAFAVGPAACSTTLGGPCRLYKFTITAARTYSVSASWQGTTDVGIYWATSAGAVITSLTACDAGGAGAGGQPETCTVTAQAAGTYYLIVDSFAPFYSAPNNVDPTDFTVTLTGQ